MHFNAKIMSNKRYNWAVLVAQLTEQLLLTPEVRGSNLCRKYENKEKRPGMAQLKKI